MHASLAAGKWSACLETGSHRSTPAEAVASRNGPSRCHVVLIAVATQLIASMQVEWVQGSAFDEASLKKLMPSVTAVVHTLGILLEADYKSGGLAGLATGILSGFKDSLSGIGENSNPLAPRDAYRKKRGAYETINRDSALAVLRAYLETRPQGSSPDKEVTRESPFVYISAEDVFRPLIPARYIATKREAEIGVQRLAETARSMMAEGIEADNEFEQLETPGRLVRPVLMRPSALRCPGDWPRLTA